MTQAVPTEAKSVDLTPESIHEDAERVKVEVASQWQLMWWKFRRHRMAMLGGIVVLMYYLVAPFARQISSDYFGLTPNEIKVALLIKQGMTTKEIAKELNLSVNTIMTHRYKIRSKLGIKNQTKNLQVFLKQFPRQ